MNYSSAQQERHPSNNPLGWFLFCLQIECPNKHGSTLLGLVHRTLIHVLGFLLINWYGSNKDDWNWWCEFLELGVLYHPSLCVPSSSFHVQAVDVGPFTRSTSEILLPYLAHITLEAHLVKRPLILSSHRLHDSSEE